MRAESTLTWYTLTPLACAFFTMSCGLPSEVRKNLTPSSILMSIHSSICFLYLALGTMVKLTPNGLSVIDLMCRSPARKSCPYRCVREMG